MSDLYDKACIFLDELAAGKHEYERQQWITRGGLKEKTIIPADCGGAIRLPATHARPIEEILASKNTNLVTLICGEAEQRGLHDMAVLIAHENQNPGLAYNSLENWLKAITNSIIHPNHANPDALAAADQNIDALSSLFCKIVTKNPEYQKDEKFEKTVQTAYQLALIRGRVGSMSPLGKLKFPLTEAIKSQIMYQAKDVQEWLLKDNPKHGKLHRYETAGLFAASIPDATLRDQIMKEFIRYVLSNENHPEWLGYIKEGLIPGFYKTQKELPKEHVPAPSIALDPKHPNTEPNDKSTQHVPMDAPSVVLPPEETGGFPFSV